MEVPDPGTCDCAEGVAVGVTGIRRDGAGEASENAAPEPDGVGAVKAEVY